MKLDVLGVTKHRAVFYLEHTRHVILLGSVLIGLAGGSNVKQHPICLSKAIILVKDAPTKYSSIVEHVRTCLLLHRLAQLVERRTTVRDVSGSSPDRTNTQGLKTTEENMLPLQSHLQMVRYSTLLG